MLHRVLTLLEGLADVPGMQIQNRQNLAQDLKMLISGFEACPTYGIRGLRYVWTALR